MYALHDYARMLADGARVSAYVHALEAAVRPGSVVVDIGTGTGFFAIVACSLGARRVYAIDPNPVIALARELARDNGCASRIEFIEGDALEVELPERADVVISDLRGGLPFAPANLAVVAHARQRFLAPGGVLLPCRDVLRVAIVGSSRRYEEAVGAQTVAGVNLASVRGRLANTLHRDRARTLRDEDLLTPGATWGEVDYRVTPPPSFRGQAAWRIERASVGYGLALWFDADLGHTPGFSTAPGREGVYPQLFLPWTSPTPLMTGDRVVVDLWVGAEGYPWGWNLRVDAADGTTRASLKQSTFLAEMSPPVRAPVAQVERGGTAP